MDDALSNIRSSVVDGRAQTPRFRQRQLAALHQSLAKAKTNIVSAISHDSHDTLAEAEAQFFLTLRALKTIYLQLDPLKMIETEYSIARGQSNPGRRAPYGCAYIMPSPTSAFYSTIVPVAAAIAAGNCVVLELAQNLSEVNALLRQVLPRTLDKLIFAVVSEDSLGEDFKKQYCIVLDGREMDDAVSTSRLITTPSTRAAAIVDRSANLHEAARDCVRARFSFNGQAAYAPAVVLVNEFSVKTFCSAVAEAALSYLTSSVDAQSNGSASQSDHPRSPKSSPSSDLKQELDDAGAVILASGARGTVALLPASSRSSPLLKRKINEPVLIIHPITSLDDAIDFLNSTASQPLIAAHIFASLESARYLSQFINASISFINGIPAELLVGPPAPNGFAVNLSLRYTREMFSTTRPEILKNTSALDSELSTLLDGQKSSKGQGKLENLRDLSLPAIKEGTGPPVGFFEQGLFIGTAVVLSTIILASAVTVKYVSPALMRRIR